MGGRSVLRVQEARVQNRLHRESREGGSAGFQEQMRFFVIKETGQNQEQLYFSDRKEQENCFEQ